MSKNKNTNTTGLVRNSGYTQFPNQWANLVRCLILPWYFISYRHVVMLVFAYTVMFIFMYIYEYRYVYVNVNANVNV